MYQNTSGSYNTAYGMSALGNNTTASNNTAVGYQALYSYQTGGDNVALGTQAGYSINGNGNSTFIGRSAGYSTTGGNNTFVGYNSGNGVTTGSKNTILGLYNGNQGGLDIRTSSNNIVLSDGDGNPRVITDSTGKTRAQSYAETYVSLSGTTPAVNCNNGNTFALTLSGNTTFTFSNPPASGTSFTFSIEIIQDASASGYTVTWPSSVDWPSATAPTLTATASAKDIFVFTTRDGGTNWYGFTAGQALG
jgi:hypothetical protein